MTARAAAVIATHNRPELLRRCLRGMSEQSVMPDEIVIVDDASDPPAAAVVDEYAGLLPVRVLRQERSHGPATARNLGWRASNGEFVLFTDDDCRPSPGWVEALLGEAEDTRIVMGRTIPDPEDGPPTSPFDRTIRQEKFDAGLPTCNVMYPRALLERVGGFDETFGLPFGEDTDLGQRVLHTGASAGYAPAAVVYHAIHRSGWRAALRERRRLEVFIRLVKQYPELRTEIWKGYFMSGEHRLLSHALGAASTIPVALRAGRGRSWPVRTLLAAAAATALLPAARYLYWVDRRNRELRDRRLRDMPAFIALDAYEMGIMIRGSLRERAVLI
jgi:GT2 family glycosyltransferase